MTLVAYTADGRAKAKGQTYAPEAVVFSVRANPQSYAQGAWTKRINWIAPDFDPVASWDSVNSRYTPKRPGYYRVTGQVQFDSNSGSALISIYKNGAQGPNGMGSPNVSGILNSSASPIITPIIYCNGTTDYVELWAYQYQPSNAAVNSAGALLTVELVGSSVGVVPESWHQINTTGEPSFQNGWTGYQACWYMKDPHGFVHIKGEIAPGTTATGTAIFQLPVGYRPSVRNYHLLSGGTGGAGAVAVAGHFMVDVNGVVRVSDDGSALPTAAKFSLDQGFTWRGDQ